MWPYISPSININMRYIMQHVNRNAVLTIYADKIKPKGFCPAFCRLELPVVENEGINVINICVSPLRQYSLDGSFSPLLGNHSITSIYIFR